MSSWMEAGHQKDQAKIKSLKYSVPPSVLQKEEGPEMELVINHTPTWGSLHKNPKSANLEIFQVGEHKHTPGGWHTSIL